jgi:class 3 adenylate cyclase/predicted ATPase
MKCSECRADNRDGAKFCNQCGSKLELECPQCRSLNPPDSKFCSECGHSLPIVGAPLAQDVSFEEKLGKIQKYLPDGLTEKILAQKDRIEGERRQVTVMFVDMTGFTSLTEKLGPEQTLTLMDQVFAILINKIHDYEGAVNELRGDGVLALFGAPIALEDAPQRAVRSALAIHKEMIEFNERIKGDYRIQPILLRIGINTGPVVVGSIGSDLRVQFAAVGDTVNMASRMETLAEPGTTYVTEQTFKLTEGFFRFEALGPKLIKGKEKPAEAYRVIAASGPRTRFDVSAERGLTPFIARRRELELLLDCFERSKAGRGQAIWLVGEAGLGKSRLLYEFRKAVANENVTFLEGKCLSYGKAVPFLPIIDILKSNFDVGDGDADSTIWNKVLKGLKMLDEAATLPYVLELLSVKDSGIDKIPSSPDAKKDRICDAIRRIVLKRAEIRPLILAIEDLHWIDKSSEDVVNHLFGSVPGARVLLLLTYRPELVQGWSEKSYRGQLNLNRLSNSESQAMVHHILGTEDVDRDLGELIVEKTEGIPFFIEEFIESLRALNALEQDGTGYRLTDRLKELNIPSTIQDVIMARLDSLPEAPREVLQIGSVIEREFSYELIKQVADLPYQDLLGHLSILEESEFIYERGIHPKSTYVFRHALTRDVVYHSILASKRKKLHSKIAAAIEHLCESNMEAIEHPERLANHLMEAGLLERAIPYWQKAAEVATRRSANVEAVGHLKKALELLARLPGNPETSRKELDVQIALGPALMAIDGYAAPEVEKVYARARRLSQELGETPRTFAILRGLWGFYIVRGELETAHELGKRCLTLAGRTGKPPLVLWAHYAVGMTFFHLGELASALEHFEQGISLYDVRKRHSHRALQDPGVACLSYKALTLWVLGYPDQAIKTSQEAVALADGLSHPFSMVYALCMGALVHQFCGRAQETYELAEAANALCTEHRIPYWLAWGPILSGWALAAKGEKEEGIKRIRDGLAAYSATQAEIARPMFLALLAESCRKGTQAGDGLAVLNEALEGVHRTEDRFGEPELHRLKGELLSEIFSDNYTEAEACFRQALEVSRRQNAKSFELRAAISLSRLWQEQGKTVEAREMLTGVYGWFTEGLDSPDLNEASQFLRQPA